jgi:hypothetical protein
MRVLCAMLTALAVTAGTAAAEQASISGTVTLKFEPPRAAPARVPTEEQRRLRECGARWNQKLAAGRKARDEAAMRRPPQEMIPQALTRVDYRRCMYACLTDPSRSC